MKKLQKQLIKLLNIHGVSGDEKSVRDYLVPILNNTMDSVHVDDYGNLLADKKVGNGNGATVMLSAHMDTVKGVLKDRKVINKDGIITSDKGALGADDRAGIAIILAVLRNLTSVNFNGNIKIAFSREEEIGCIGSGKIDVDWYKNVDLAIVADRRGNRDIVVGCGTAFCSNSIGEFMENVGQMVDMDWKCVEGGISDALTFSENGVNSINLSVGYMNEHTEKEYVVIDDMRDTTRLILQVLAVINDFYKDFQKVTYENKWVLNWGNAHAYGYDYYEDDYYGDAIYNSDIWAETEDMINGDAFIYELDNEVIIHQNSDKVILSRQGLKELMSQLKGI